MGINTIALSREVSEMIENRDRDVFPTPTDFVEYAIIQLVRERTLRSFLCRLEELSDEVNTIQEEIFYWMETEGMEDCLYEIQDDE